MVDEQRAQEHEPVLDQREDQQRPDFETDSEQLRVLGRLERLFGELEDYRQYRAGKLNRLVTNLGAGRRPPRGMYIWGGVGRGKSLMMDAFFKGSRHRRKRRHIRGRRNHLAAGVGRRDAGDWAELPGAVGPVRDLGD